MIKTHKYRFKTMQEFITEYGDNWRDVRCSFVEQMDCLLGVDIDEKYDKKFDIIFNDNNLVVHTDYRGNDKDGVEQYCNVSIDMVKKINLTPTYKPKKLVY